MRRLPRRLALWGGAAAIASGGFAFMASNSMAASSSAGDGSVAVTGYTVGTISYSPVYYSGHTGSGDYIQTFSFPLSSVAKTAPGNGVPGSLLVTLTFNGTALVGGGRNTSTLPYNSTYGDTGIYNANANFGCSIPANYPAASGGWHFLGTGSGTGTVTCTLNIAASAEHFEATLTKVDVEASN